VQKAPEKMNAEAK
jgi:hypothetical protein